MAWYKWMLIAAGVLIGTRLLKLVPHQYEDAAAIGAILLVFVAVPLLMRKARSSAESASAENQASPNEILDSSDAQYSLYLRSFESDGNRPGDNILRRHLLDAYGMPEEQYEVSLVSKLNFIAPVVAIGRPASNTETQLGAARYYVTDGENWQDKVKELVEHANLIVVRADAITPGLEWELNIIERIRKFRNTSIILSTARNRPELYHRLLTILPSWIKECLPADVGEIKALYVDSNGKFSVLEKSVGLIGSVEEWVSDEVVKLAKEDLASAPDSGSNKVKYSVAGVRCWHREGIGLTPKNSYAGKVVISSDQFLFLSSGESLMKKILDQGGVDASVNLTQGLTENALEAEGSVRIAKGSLLEMEVKGSLIKTPQLIIKYRSHDGNMWCSLAFDGQKRNTVENLNQMAENLQPFRGE